MKHKEMLKAHILKIIVVIIWGADYIFAKWALTSFEPLTLVYFKYVIATAAIILVKIILKRKFFLRKKDILLYVICALTGEILYYQCEYTAMNYMPVALITIVLSFVPAMSISIERLIFKKKATKKMNIGIIVCILGVGMVIGADFKILFDGRLIGYIFCFGAVLAWNCYNFTTSILTKRYDDFAITLNQLVCVLIILSPYALIHLPSIEEINMQTVWSLLYLGVISGGVGIYISIYGIRLLGETTSAVYSNFLPVTATFFGWLVLKEIISTTQIVGGIIVIIAGIVVIVEKGHLDNNIQ